MKVSSELVTSLEMVFILFPARTINSVLYRHL